MSARPIYKNTTYMLTRRTTQRLYLLRPSKKVNACIQYCVAIAQRRSGIQIHSLVFMSNHYHMVVTDEEGTLPIFTEELNKNLAKALNCLHSRWENLWSGGDKTNYLTLADEETVLEKTVYALSNPTKAGLTSHGGDWPGVRLFRKAKYLTKKPDFFFRPEDKGGKLPDRLQLELTAPPIGAHEKIAEDIVQSATTKEEKSLRNDWLKSGKKFLGKAGVKAQEVHASPKTPATHRKMCPRVACKDKWLRIKMLLSLKAFEEAYKPSQKRFSGGDHSVEFPLGTYRMPRFYGARCAEE